jgi:protein tyrosine phosphatase
MFGSNNADLIIPGLWLGNAKASMDEDFLKKNNIVAVFNCTKDLPFHSYSKKRFRIPIDDNLKDEEIRNLELWSFEAIYKLTKEHKQGNVLVHCYAGMQRSAAVVAMYLIAKYNMKTEEVIPFIKSKRGIVFMPLVNFNKAISGFERSYQKDIIPKLIDD